ncbi:MAG: hypothetical protein G01um101466_359 [Parcubacteria group bacterium Gr01-1014_66]|nr:MAG: hypothetical protein G01um101466_359 [Parcubacteria group bacterium Gr01-1014_66]
MHPQRFFIGILFLWCTFLLASPFLASAQSVPAESNTGKGVLQVLTEGTIGVPAAGTVLAVAYLIQQLLVIILGYVAYFLQQAFIWNLYLVPATSDIARAGWRVLREIANGLFILLVLWIALTIILNIEQWGGRKLLGKVIVVALLLNFSLVLVSTVFGAANYISRVFANKIELEDAQGHKTYDVAGYVIQKTQFHTFLQSIPQNAEDLQKVLAEQEKLKKPAEAKSPPSTRKLFAMLGAPPARAQTAGQVIGGTALPLGGCTLGAAIGSATIPIPIVGTAVGCGVGGIAGAIASIFIFGKGLFESTARLAVSTILSVIFLGVMISVFLYGALSLLTRLFQMIYLSIFAPVAFLSFLIPGDGPRKYRGQWLHDLFNWAFFAPAYFFLNPHLFPHSSNKLFIKLIRIVFIKY